MFDFSGHDLSFGIVGHVPQMPSGDGILWWTVSTDINSEEVISLILGLKLGSKLCLWNLGSGWLSHVMVDLVHDVVF